MVQPVPDGYPRVTPYLHVDGGRAAMDFYADVLGATQRGDVLIGPDGRVGHAEMAIGDSLIMVADEAPHIGVLGPRSVGGTPVTIHVYVPDVDETFRTALEAGATELRPVQDFFYGDRGGTFEDPFGHHWSIATHVEDLTPEQMRERMGHLPG